MFTIQRCASMCPPKLGQSFLGLRHHGIDAVRFMFVSPRPGWTLAQYIVSASKEISVRYLVPCSSGTSDCVTFQIVQLCTGAWGCPDLPQTLDEFKDYTKSLVVRKPIPEWFLQILDILDEVKDTATCSKTQFCAFPTYSHIPNLNLMLYSNCKSYSI